MENFPSFFGYKVVPYLYSSGIVSGARKVVAYATAAIL